MHSLTVINNGIYGGSSENEKLSVTLLRTAVYSAHPVVVDGVTREIAPTDRVHEHLDIGERDFKFRICANEKHTDSLAEIFNQQPYVLSVFPSGSGKNADIDTQMNINNRNIILSAYRKEDNKKEIRLFNSSGMNEKALMMFDNMEIEIDFLPYEVKTFCFENDKYFETDMLGNIL